MSKKLTVSAKLSPIAREVYLELNKHKPHGWFTQFVNEALIRTYLPKIEEKVLKEVLIRKQKEVDEIHKDMDKIIKRIRKVKK